MGAAPVIKIHTHIFLMIKIGLPLLPVALTVSPLKVTGLLLSYKGGVGLIVRQIQAFMQLDVGTSEVTSTIVNDQSVCVSLYDYW